MAKGASGLPGFRDFYPEEMSARRRVFDAVEDAAARYGFREIGTPALERTRMYVDKSGEELAMYAALGEKQGRRFADAAGGAGDGDDFSFDSGHSGSPDFAPDEVRSGMGRT